MNTLLCEEVEEQMRILIDKFGLPCGIDDPNYRIPFKDQDKEFAKIWGIDGNDFYQLYGAGNGYRIAAVKVDGLGEVLYAIVISHEEMRDHPRFSFSVFFNGHFPNGCVGVGGLFETQRLKIDVNYMEAMEPHYAFINDLADRMMPGNGWKPLPEFDPGVLGRVVTVLEDLRKEIPLNRYNGRPYQRELWADVDEYLEMHAKILGFRV